MPKFRPRGRGSPTSERQSAGGQLKGKRLPVALDRAQAVPVAEKTYLFQELY